MSSPLASWQMTMTVRQLVQLAAMATRRTSALRMTWDYVAWRYVGFFSVMIVMDHVIAVITEKSTGCFRRHHLWRLSRVTRLAALMAAWRPRVSTLWDADWWWQCFLMPAFFKVVQWYGGSGNALTMMCFAAMIMAWVPVPFVRMSEWSWKMALCSWMASTTSKRMALWCPHDKWHAASC